MREVAAVILRNPSGEFLCYLRTDTPSIPFPNHWDLFGGHIEPGETPEEALVREVEEELGITLEDYTFWKSIDCLEGDAYPNRKHLFYATIDAPADELTLYEGQRLAYIKPDNIEALPFAHIWKDVLHEFLRFAEK